MHKRVTQLIVAMLLILAVGGQWAILQTAAWVGMVITYSQTDGLPVALKKTFDGNHPCQLCHVVEQGRQAEKSPEMQVELTKLELVCYSTEQFSLPHRAESQPRLGNIGFLLRSEPPPLPPPIPA